MVERLKIEWFQKKVTELENDSKRTDALVNMQCLVLNSDKKTLNDLVHNVSINPIFECLTRCSGHDVEVSCSIIYTLLAEMTANELLGLYGELIHRCLTHDSDEVRKIAIMLIKKNLDEKTIETICNKHAPLIMDVVSCVTSLDLGTACEAMVLLTTIGINNVGISALYSHNVLKKLKEIMTLHDAVRFRVYEIVVDVSKISSENLAKGISSGLMEQLLSEISSSDDLILLNALELLSRLAESNHGLNYLQEHNVIQDLVDKVLKLNEEPLSPIVLPGIIKFFGKLCIFPPDNFSSEYHQIMDLLFNNLDTKDEVFLRVIIITVGQIGSSQVGRLALAKYEGHMNNFFRKIGQLLTLKNDDSLPAMSSLCELVKDINGDANLSLISKNWFDLINPNALDSIFNIAKLPFDELRLSALTVLKAIASQEWGTEKLSNYPGMIEFLTDRSTKFNKDCKEMKYGIIVNMVQCPNIEKLVSQQILFNLKEFLREGPFYTPVNVEMATEGTT